MFGDLPSDGNWTTVVGFEAYRSSGHYGKSTVVQPYSIRHLALIRT